MSVIDAIIAKKLCGGGGGGSVPKPLTYDYMPEGYPKKSVQTITLMEEQELAFTVSPAGAYTSTISENSPEIVVGQTYTVKWDGTEYERVCSVFGPDTFIGNLSIIGAGDDTGEPFLYTYRINRGRGTFGTPDTSASHTISVKTTGEVITPMAEGFLPTGITAVAIDNAQTAADNAQTAADNAQTAADNVNQKTKDLSSASFVTGTITVTRSSGTSGEEASDTSLLPNSQAHYYLSYEGDALPTKDTLVSSSYKIKYASESTSDTLSVTESNIFVSDQGDKAIFVSGVGLIATEPGTYTFSTYREGASVTLTKRGIYLYYAADANSYVCSFEFAGIYTAAKANFGSDGLVLYSNNGKKFKITVNDSGTISATEVT